MVRILRITRHLADEEQKKALIEVARKLGYDTDVTITEYTSTVNDVGVIIQMVKEQDIHIVEAVLPIGMLAQLLAGLKPLGIPLIRAIMGREVKEDGTVAFHFRGYELVEKVEVVTRPL